MKDCIFLNIHRVIYYFILQIKVTKLNKTIPLASFALIIILFSGLFPVLDVYAAVPNAPTNLFPGNPTDSTITLNWNAPSGTITGYQIESAAEISFDVYAPFSILIADTGDTTTTITLTNINAGDFFLFRVSAINADGVGAPSNIIEEGAAFFDFVDFVEIFFSSGQIFGDGSTFVDHADFSDGTQTFGDGTTFGDSTHFGTGQDFFGDYTFGDNIIFDGGSFDTAQTFGTGGSYSGSIDWEGINTFGANSIFTGAQDWNLDGVQNFGDGTQFNAIMDFPAGQDFNEDMIFFAGQTFPAGEAYNFLADDMDFKTGTDFGAARTFGDDMTYLGDMVFYGSNTFGTDVFFDTAHDDWATDLQTWGVGPQFFGNTDFITNQDFPFETHFGTGQDFPLNEDYTFNDHAFFESLTDFQKARAFEEFTHFDGVVTFEGTNTWKEGTEYAALQTFPIGFAQSFADDAHFGDNTNFGDTEHTFSIGTTFGLGTDWLSGQDLPLGVVPEYGLLLENIVCGTDTTGKCVPDASKYLAPGELLAPGIDPAAVSHAISADDDLFSLIGLGITLDFATVTTAGNIDIDPIDPATLTTSTAGTATGARVVEIGGTGIETVGTFFEITVGATVTGSTNITIPYDENSFPEGFAEVNAVGLHFTNGAWETIEGCTVDTTNNNITCPLTSFSPVGVGAGTGGSGGGGCTSCAPPVLGIDRHGNNFVSNGFTYNGFPTDVQYFFTPYPLITVEVGEPNNAKFKIYDDVGPDYISHFEFAFGLKQGQIISQTPVAIEWDRNFLGEETVSILDPDNVLSDVAVVVTEDICDKGNILRCLVISIDHTFRESLQFDIVATNVWDDRRNSSQNYYNHGIHITGDSLNPDKFANKGTQVLKRIDKINDIWVPLDDDMVTKYQKNSVGTFIPIEWKEFKRHQDPIQNVMTRLNSNFDAMVNYEKIRAVQHFDSSLIQGTIDDPIESVYVHFIPRLEKLGDEINAEQVKAQETMDELLHPERRNG